MGFLNMFSGSTSANDPTSYFDNDGERQTRLENYKRVWDAYLAELPDPIVQDGPSNDNVKVNPARAIINTGVFFLFGQEIKFELSADASKKYGQDVENGTEDEGDTAVTEPPDWLKDLNKCWKANRKMSFLYNLGLSGSIHGTPFIKIVPNAAGLNNDLPRLLLLDPANVDVEWDPNDCTRVLKFIIEYVTEDEKGEPVLRIQETSANVDANDVIQDWTIQDYEQPMAYVVGTGWVPMAIEERTPVGPPVQWPYPWAPIEYCQNIELPHMFWGLPDLDSSSIDVIESLQRSMSSLNKIVRIHASPRMFAKNVMPDQVDDIDVSADNIITLPNMEAELDVLETLTNLSPSIDFTDKVREDLLDMVQTPAIALGKFDAQKTTVSGITQSILYAPLIQKTDLKRISYGDMLERLNHKLLILMGYEDPDEYEGLITTWPESMPGSAYLERQTLQQDQAMGVSKYTIMQRLGYDPVEEQKRELAEQEEQMKLKEKYTPKPDPGQGPGGNKNPSGKGGSGSMGGVNAAGTPKTNKNDPKGPKDTSK